MYLNLFERYWNWVGKFHEKAEIVRAKQAKKKADAEKRQAAIKKLKESYPKVYQSYLACSGAHGSKDDYNEELDAIFVDAIDSGLDYATRNEHYCLAKFQNGTRVKFWISNKWYAYAQNTHYLSKDGEETDFGIDKPSFPIRFLINAEVESKAKRKEIYGKNLKDF